MADQLPMIIGDERVASDESIEVRSPFDGSVVGTVAKGSEEHLDRAVAVAKALHKGGPLPAHERAAILDRAGRALADRVDEFATVISAEAAKPIKTATGRGRPGRSTPPTSPPPWPARSAAS